MTSGPIVIIEDDPDDQELYEQLIREMGIDNEFRFFSSAQPAWDYLIKTPEKPFIILSDVNLPVINGIEFKAMIQQNDYLREKAIPFVFISTNANKPVIRQAHQLGVQGYFQKAASLKEMKTILSVLFGYWALCRHINNT